MSFFNVSTSNGKMIIQSKMSNSQFLKSIPGLSLWFDATDPLNTGVPPANGASITTWYDKSSNGYNANIAGHVNSGNHDYFSYDASLPPITYSSTGFNGKPGIYFNGSNNNTAASGFLSSSFSMSTTGMTVFYLLQNSNSTGNPNYTSYGSNIMINTNRGVIGSQVYNNSLVLFNSNATVFNSSINNNIPLLYDYWLDGYYASGSIIDASSTSISSNLYNNTTIIIYYKYIF